MLSAFTDFLGLSKPELYAEQFGWTYYIHRRWTFFPRYMQGTLIFCAWYWETWPVDQEGNVVEMYRAKFPYDPRTRV